MNAVGIDVSKEKSTVAIMRPFGEVVAEPFEISHTDAELKKLAYFLEKLPEETCIVMEYTESYWQPIAKVLHNAGLFVSVANALLIYKYGNNSIRKGKTDKLDAVKIANYCLERWTALEHYAPVDQIRQTLKTCRRQYDQYIRLKVNLKNNLITLLDGAFPGINTLFKSAPRDMDEHEKWANFSGKFWNCECVCENSEKVFANQYRKWCAKAGYRFSAEKAASIYAHASLQANALPMTDAVKCLITYAVTQLNAIIETISVIQCEMHTLASQLPEYPVVMLMFGVGPVLGPQLMAEIGSVRRFHRKQSLVAFAGVDAPPCQSGTFESRNRHISKRGSPRLRKTLFQVMSTIIQHAPADDPVFQFLDRKRQEGKHYYGFAATKTTVVKEYLYHSPNGQRAMVFSRDYQNFVFREGPDKKKRELISEAVASNQLYFSVACTMNEKACMSAMRWFREHLLFSRDYTDLSDQLIEYSENPSMLQAIKQYAVEADLGIQDMKFELKSTELATANQLPANLPDDIKAALEQFMNALADAPNVSERKLQMGEVNVTSFHCGLDKEGQECLYSLPLSVESDGTRRLMALAPAIEHVLACGGILLVDELENRIHPLLMQLIVSKFQSPNSNPNHAQLIFTTHNTELLDADLIRKDQIYFVDKDKRSGSSSLYSISEFFTPTNENIRKGYLKGKYGATPDLDIDEV